MTASLRDIGLIMRHELADALRSRRAALVLALYLGTAVLFMNVFINVLHRLEGELSEMLRIPASASAGTVADALWGSQRLRRMIGHLVGDPSLVDGLMRWPPIVLLYGWVVFLFTPLLVLLSSAGRIAEELGSGSVRYIAFRTDRLSWSIGKFGGQALQTLVALLLGAVAAWTVARFRLHAMDAWTVAYGMGVFALRGWLYALPFLGLALGLSQVTRSDPKATVLSFVAFATQLVLYGIARHFRGDGLRAAWDVLLTLLPQGHYMDLWRMDLPHLVTASAYLAALAALPLLAGHAALAGRDL